MKTTGKQTVGKNQFNEEQPPLHAAFSVPAKKVADKEEDSLFEGAD